MFWRQDADEFLGAKARAFPFFRIDGLFRSKILSLFAINIKMLRMMKYVYLFALLALFAECSGQQKNNAAVSTEAATAPPTFQMVTIPGVLTSPDERAEYLVLHYWDHFDFSDTACIHLPQIVEQAFVDYVEIMPYTTTATVASSIQAMLKKAEAEEKVFTYFTDLYEKYLYDPNSPMRNDEFYIPVLEAILASPLQKEKTRPAYLLDLAKRNRIGEKAADFTYTLADGKKATLHALSADYTLLFFYNPDCRNCQEVSEQLQASPAVQYLLKDYKMKVLAVYPDLDLTAWRNYLLKMPREWINSYDATMHLQNEEVYDLKAIPTLYLLDKDKKVLLKDPSFEQLDNYLAALVPQQ
jgi:thiol-disulfide isomerase/thioredoxin